MSEKTDLWVLLAQPKYPKLTEGQLFALSMQAASKWYLGDTDELAELYDQYVMMKNLKDL
jgi:hypothetical protein